VQLVTPKSDGSDEQDSNLKNSPKEKAKRVSLGPLLGLKSYLLRHKGMLVAAFLALVFLSQDLSLYEALAIALICGGVALEALWGRPIPARRRNAAP